MHKVHMTPAGDLFASGEKLGIQTQLAMSLMLGCPDMMRLVCSACRSQLQEMNESIVVGDGGDSMTLPLNQTGKLLDLSKRFKLPYDLTTVLAESVEHWDFRCTCGTLDPVKVEEASMRLHDLWLRVATAEMGANAVADILLRHRHRQFLERCLARHRRRRNKM